ncbi:MAG TPA: DNA methyltransferase [Chloroflexota bacterium]|nr:DNA methyltransferase [Chloroflexota bacterium]
MISQAPLLDVPGLPQPASDSNRLSPSDRAFHDWYRFVLSFPPHLVRQYLGIFGIGPGQTVLDPFCGTGTVLVESKKLGINSIGVEASPMAHFASTVKTDWDADAGGLVSYARSVAALASDALRADGTYGRDSFDLVSPAQFKTLSDEQSQLLLTESISPLPLHKTLALLEAISSLGACCYEPYAKLALAKALVSSIGNLQFGPEVGVGPRKLDAPVVDCWLNAVEGMARDLSGVEEYEHARALPHLGDAREVVGSLAPESVDAVITSPPYPNEKDYTRATRLESVLLGFIRNKDELRAVKRGLLRSNTRGVYKADDDDQWVSQHPEIQRIADEIEARRIALGKTSGFERMYARVTRLYFGGIAKHLAELRTALRPGAQLAYVVGDQASYLRVMIRTGQLIAEIAESLGYELVGIDLFRTRLATATREQLREEVVVLRWPGRR